MNPAARMAAWQRPWCVLLSLALRHTLRGLRFILKFLWHLERQNLNTVASLRANVMPWPGYMVLEQNQHFSSRMVGRLNCYCRPNNLLCWYRLPSLMFLHNKQHRCRATNSRLQTFAWNDRTAAEKSSGLHHQQRMVSTEMTITNRRSGNLQNAVRRAGCSLTWQQPVSAAGFVLGFPLALRLGLSNTRSI